MDSFQEGRLRQARSFLEEGVSKMSETPEVQHVGMVRYMLGDEGAARAALPEAASSTADFQVKRMPFAVSPFST